MQTNDRACDGLQITIANEGCGAVNIRELECMHPTCNNAKINFVGGEEGLVHEAMRKAPNITIEHVLPCYD